MNTPLRSYTVVIEPDEDDYHAFAPALPGCHTIGRTIEEAITNITEAIALHVEALLADGEPVPEEAPLLITRIPVPA